MAEAAHLPASFDLHRCRQGALLRPLFYRSDECDALLLRHGDTPLQPQRTGHIAGGARDPVLPFDIRGRQYLGCQQLKLPQDRAAAIAGEPAYLARGISAIQIGT